MVLLDPADRVLLLQASDPADPAKGPWWELPGGGMESGRAERGGGGPGAVRGDRHRRASTWARACGATTPSSTFGGYHFDQHEHVHVARLTAGRIAGIGSWPDAYPGDLSGGGAEGAASSAAGSAVPAAADYRDPEGRFGPPGLEPLEAMAFKGYKWWTSGEVIEMVTEGTRIIPPWLPGQLSAYLSGRIGAGPVDMGELGNAF